MNSYWVFFSLNIAITVLLAALAASRGERHASLAALYGLVAQFAVQFAVAAVLFWVNGFYRWVAEP